MRTAATYAFTLRGEHWARDPIASCTLWGNPNNLEVEGADFAIEIEPTSNPEEMHVSGHPREGAIPVADIARRIAGALAELPYELEVTDRDGETIVVLTHPNGR